MHARLTGGIGRGQWRAVETLIDIVADSGGLIEDHVAMGHDRDFGERIQRLVGVRSKFDGFQIAADAFFL